MVFYISRFKPIKRDMNYLFPPSMSDWYPIEIAVSREAHHPDPLGTRFTEPLPLKEGATEAERMRHLLLTITERALYAKRKCTAEPVIGIIKVILGFRQFLATRTGKRQMRAESGGDGVEFEANVCAGGVI